jgi:E3 ubiquitin-protein ligase NEDD4
MEENLHSFHFFYFSTCFNRIDLPNYASKKDLYEKLRQAVTLSSVGFDME